MAKREVFIGAHAYNLVRGAMLLAAAMHGESPAAMGFAKARAELTCILIASALTPTAGSANWEAMLLRIATGKHPPRRKPRPPEPRRKRHRREIFPPLKGDRATARTRISPPDEPSSVKS